MHRILQADAPDDFVLATGEARSVREFVEIAFAELGRGIEWRGKGIEETGVDGKSGKTVVRIDPQYFRPTEVDELIGDCQQGASKARLDTENDVRPTPQGNGGGRSRNRQAGGCEWQERRLS
jgi:GDP-D-mannose dehydratase